MLKYVRQWHDLAASVCGKYIVTYFAKHPAVCCLTPADHLHIVATALWTRGYGAALAE